MIMAGAEPFFLPGNNGKGVLLLHGFTGTPAELRELGEKLHEQGYSVMAPLLPGHGTEPSAMEEVTWQDWYQAAKTAYYELGRSCLQVYIVGMSMGSLLTLVLAQEVAPQGIIVISTPIFLYDWRVHFRGIMQFFLTAIKKRPRIIDADKRYNVSYNVMPIKGVIQVLDLLNYVKHEVLPKVTVPCLIVQSRTEHTVKPASADYIHEHLGSKSKEIFWVENSKHVITLYKSRELLYQAISKFIEDKKL